MKDRGNKQFSIRTLLLALATLILVFSLFVMLPASLPSIDDIDQNIFWACTHLGTEPEKYFTWTWDTSEQPTLDEWMDVLEEGQFYELKKCAEITSRTFAGEPDLGLLTHFHRTLPDKGMGKIQAELNPENEDQIIISGYLQYGILPNVDDDTIKLLQSSFQENPSTGINASSLIPEIMKLLKNTPLPSKYGVIRNTDLNVAVFSFDNNYVMQPRQYIISTDNQGYFRLIIEPDPEADYFDVQISNPDQVITLPGRSGMVRTFFRNTVYYSSRLLCGATADMKREQEARNRAWVFGGIILAAGTFLLVWYFTHRKRNEIDEESEPVEELKPDLGTEIESVTGGQTERLEIIFPQIEKPLPDVWDRENPLEVRFRLVTDIRDVIPNTECGIDWGDGISESRISDSSGEATSYHRFTDKGNYDITGAYTDPDTEEKASSWRTIRIVDYREEMVRLFNRMVRTLDIESITIVDQMTAREVEVILRRELDGLPDEVLQAVVAGFEEANYSIHPISRESYVGMYLAVKEVNDFGEQRQQPTEDTPE